MSDETTEVPAWHEDALGMYFAPIKCSYCGVEPGFRCRTVSDRPHSDGYASAHAARWKEATEAQRRSYRDAAMPPAIKKRARELGKRRRPTTPAEDAEARAKVMLWALDKCGGDETLARDALERAIRARRLMQGADE